MVYNSPVSGERKRTTAGPAARRRNQLFAVQIDTSGGSFQVGKPQVLFDDLPAVTGDGDYNVSDAQRFLVVEPAGDETAPAGVTVVVNWLDDLRRRVPN